MLPYTPYNLFKADLQAYNIGNPVTMLDLRNECVINYTGRYGRKVLLLYLSELGYNVSFHNDIKCDNDIVELQLYKSNCMDFELENVKERYKAGLSYALTSQEFKDLSNRMLTDELNISNKDLLYYEKRIHVKYCSWMIELERFTEQDVVDGLNPDHINLLLAAVTKPTVFKALVDQARSKDVTYEDRVALINTKFQEELYFNRFNQQPEGQNKLELIKRNEQLKKVNDLVKLFEVDKIYSHEELVALVAKYDPSINPGIYLQRSVNSILKDSAYKLTNLRTGTAKNRERRYQFVCNQ